MDVVQVYQKDLTLWSPRTKRIYDNDLWASVVQIGGGAKISLPATSIAVNRISTTAAYLKYPFFFEPTTEGQSPPISQVTRLTQGYLDDDGTASPRNSYIYHADALVVESDGAATVLPALEAGDLLVVEGSINNGSPAVLGTESDPTDVASEKPRIGAFGQVILGRTATSNARDFWLIPGNDGLDAFSPKTGHDYITVERDPTDDSLTIDSTHQANLDVLWPSCCVIEADIFIDQLLYTGGMSDWDTMEVASRIYSYDGTVTTLSDCPESLVKSASLSIPTGNVVMFTGGLSDSLSDSKTSIVFFDPYTKTWDNGTYFLNTARRDHRMVIVNNGSSDLALVIGGKAGIFSDEQSGPGVWPVSTPLNKCELIVIEVASAGDAPAAVSTNTGSMSDARYAFGCVKLPDGRVLVVGGIGGNPSTETIDETDDEFDHELNSCEIYDPVTGQWSPIQSMRDSHSYCVCSYIPKSNRVYVYGGYASTKVEYLELDTMRWHVSRYVLDSACVAGVPIDLGFDFSALIGGGSYSQATTVFTANDDAVDGSSWNSLRTNEPEYARYDGLNAEWILGDKSIADNWWTIGPYLQFGNYSGTDIRWSDAALDGVSARFMLAKSNAAQSIDTLGPFIFDTGQPYTISGVNLVLDQAIKKGSYTGTITLTSGASSVRDGYLVFNYGYSSATGPVRCFGGIDDVTLMVDSGFKFPFDLAPGDSVNVLYQKSVLGPDMNIGAFWATASSAGRIAAIELLKNISAAGIELDITTRYPGDRGLGGEGEPWSDNYRLSDIVQCFGGNNLDAELEEAKGI